MAPHACLTLLLLSATLATHRTTSVAAAPATAVSGQTSAEDKLPEEVTEEAAQQEGEGEPSVSAQHFLPSFSPIFPPLGHSRPAVLFQEPAHSQRRPYQNSFHTGSGGGYLPTAFGRETAGYLRPATALASASGAATTSEGLLGSGNFGVIRGGTFYASDEEGGGGGSYDYGGGEGPSSFGGYYSHNGHSRPAPIYGGNPRPHHQHQDFFANFRDFADINTPTKTAYSQFVVVYANRNDTANNATTTTESDTAAVRGRPKNIIEQLAMLDQEQPKPVKKVGKGGRLKAKLAAEAAAKGRRLRGQSPKSKMTDSAFGTEPLLALS